jgi:hypothetical protein
MNGDVTSEADELTIAALAMIEGPGVSKPRSAAGSSPAPARGPAKTST